MLIDSLAMLSKKLLDDFYSFMTFFLASSSSFSYLYISSQSFQMEALIISTSLLALRWLIFKRFISLEATTSNLDFQALVVLFWIFISFFKAFAASLQASMMLIWVLATSTLSTIFFATSLADDNFLFKFLFTSSYMMRKCLT